MTVEIDFWQIIWFGCALVGAFWAVLKICFVQYEKSCSAKNALRDARDEERTRRLASIETILKEDRARVDTMLQRHDDRIQAIERELPMHYVRREDYVRGQSVLEARLDGLWHRIENLFLKRGSP